MPHCCFVTLAIQNWCIRWLRPSRFHNGPESLYRASGLYMAGSNLLLLETWCSQACQSHVCAIVDRSGIEIEPIPAARRSHLHRIAPQVPPHPSSLLPPLGLFFFVRSVRCWNDPSPPQPSNKQSMGFSIFMYFLIFFL